MSSSVAASTPAPSPKPHRAELEAAITQPRRTA